MKQTAKYVGLDVHQATTVAVVGDDTGRVIARSVVPTEATALLEFMHGMRGAVHVALEEGTQAQWLYDLLVGRVAQVVVCDRRGEPRRGSKGDWHDAEMLMDRLRQGELRAVYHGSPHRAALRELARAYRNLTEDATRVMSRLKALFRARGIRTTGRGVYDPTQRADWLAKLGDAGVRFRAATLYAELEVLRALRPSAKVALITEAQRDPAWGVLRTVPFLGPVRVALVLATLQTPWRFRTKRQLWAYAGLAVVTRTTAEYALDASGRPVKRRRPPMTRGLNQNHNHVVKEVFKGAATVAAVRAGEFRDLYQGLLARGMREELARLTLTRKLAALTLRLWKTGERYDATKLTSHAVPAR